MEEGGDFRRLKKVHEGSNRSHISTHCHMIKILQNFPTAILISSDYALYFVAILVVLSNFFLLELRVEEAFFFLEFMLECD